MNGILSAFANGLVLSGLLTVAVGLLMWILPKRALNAATRYVIWWVALALVIASPLLYLPASSSPGAPLQIAGATPAPGSSIKIPESTPAPARAANVAREAPAPEAVRPAAKPGIRVPLGSGVVGQLLLLTLFFAGALMTARVVVTYLLLEGRKSRAVPAPGGLENRVVVWLHRFGSGRKNVRLLSCSEISAPMAAGPHRPAILIPASLFDRLPNWQLEQIGLHEAAHLARYDDYALLLQRSIEAVFFWNPLVRWITRRIELEREIACDDLVVSATGEPREYAACLTNMAELSGKLRRSLAAAGATQQGKQLGRRVETLLDKSRQQATRVLRLRAAAVIVAQVALVFWAAAMPGMLIFADSTSQTASTAIEQAIAAQAIRLDTVQAGHGFADMQPLKKVIGNARIVSLGEATHGTREFFQLKHRMLEFLATEMGFTIFSIEANMPEAYRLNDFVLNGRGDPKQLLKGMYFWTWDTEEVLDMILWMREFNKSGKGRVEFTGFDMQFPGVALSLVADFVERYDPSYFAEVRQASSLASLAAAPAGRPGFGVATGTFPVEKAAGKRVRYSGYIKTENVNRGFAGLWWRADAKDGRVLAFDNMQTRGVKGTADWQRYEIELSIPAETVNINFGAIHTGNGIAWFDSLAVELDGQRYTELSELDFDFESASTNGFYTGGNGYEVKPDKGIFHSGAQSLQMRYTGPSDPPVTDDRPAGRAAWDAVLNHLKATSEDYKTRGAPATETEWALQNARVVQQCLRMYTNEVSRDESMAANVKWILEQSPGAKIVLWAHNGHVARGGQGGFRSMGSYLDKMYGDQMVVFGFAFNQGSFQAIKQAQEGGGLQDFTVPSAPAGSLDATLAAAGIPILALDVRQAPSGSELATWLSQPHKTRSIGAGFSEETASNYLTSLNLRDSFDVVLFVEKTTAALKNAGGPQRPLFVPGTKTGIQDYRDEETGVSFKLPDGWSLQQSGRWGERETTAWFGGQDPKWFTAVYYKILSPASQTSAEAIMQRLRDDVPRKVEQRHSQGMPDYRINMETCRVRTIGGRQALSCRAEYTDKGQPMGEYLTWVGSENTHALFFGRAPAADYERFCAQFDVVIETLKIP